MRNNKRLLFAASDNFATGVDEILEKHDVYAIKRDGFAWVKGKCWDYYPKDGDEVYSNEILLKAAQYFSVCHRDPSVLLLAERCNTDFDAGAFLLYGNILKTIKWIVYTLENVSPDYVFFHNTPHCLTNYLLFSIAKAQAIPVVVVNFSPIPWRKFVTLYSNGQESLLENKTVQSGDCAVLVDYYRGLMEYNKSIPFVDALLKSSSKNRSISFKDDFAASGRLAGVLKAGVKAVLKYRAYNALVRLSEVKEHPSPYVVFFLHYQPEESTLPRGRVFANQLVAIQYLRALLPKNIALIIKEHPSLYRRAWTIFQAVRSPKWYQEISNFPNTYFVDINDSTEKLINNSLFVATICGTVTIEALARGKKVLNFGSSQYRGISGVVTVDNPKSTFSFEDMCSTVDGEAVLKDLIYCLHYTFSPPGLAFNSERLNDCLESSCALKAALLSIDNETVELDVSPSNFGIVGL